MKALLFTWYLCAWATTSTWERLTNQTDNDETWEDYCTGVAHYYRLRRFDLIQDLYAQARGARWTRTITSRSL